MKYIKLTKGEFAIVDDEDFDRLNKFKWYAQKMKHSFYAGRAVRVTPTKQKSLFMHREILGITDRNIWVDHKDHNGLNNTRENLRICNRSQNTANRKKYKGTSIFLGVCRYKSKWRAGLKYKGKQHHLGDFDSEEQAAKAYNLAAIKFHGEFAKINPI